MYIIIVTFNGVKWLQKCLESTIPYPVIIVDNNSNDETVGFIKENFPEVTLFTQKENLGFGQANNIGIKKARQLGANNVFLLNQDAYLNEGTLGKLVQLQNNNPDYGILSPIHLNGDASGLDKNFSSYLLRSKNNQFYSDYVLDKSKSNVYEVPFINAAGWLLSKKCLETVGGFDPLFFHYGEDDNYCQRVNFHGLKIGVVPNIFLKHDREERKAVQSVPYSATFYKNMERSLKIKYADINFENINHLEKKLKYLIKSRIKSILKFKNGAAANYGKEIELIKKILPEIKKSRATNKKIGSNYL